MEYYKTDEIKQMFHVDIETIRRWAKKKRIPCIKIGKFYYFPKDQIDALMENL